MHATRPYPPNLRRLETQKKKKNTTALIKIIMARMGKFSKGLLRVVCFCWAQNAVTF